MAETNEYPGVTVSRLGTVGVGRLYRGAGGCIPTGWTYRVLCLAKAVPVYQYVVVYEGVAGPDAGAWFVCSPYDFCIKFRPVPEPEPEVPLARGTRAIVIKEGSGY